MSLPHTPEELRGLCVELPPRTFTPDLRGLIAWLETQNPETPYDYDSVCGCVVAQFLIHIGERRRDGHCNGMFLSDVFGGIFHLDLYHQVCATEPQTFGGALKRARAALASTPCT